MNKLNLVAIISLAFFCAMSSSAITTVEINQIDDHTALTDVKRGIEDTLSQAPKALAPHFTNAHGQKLELAAIVRQAMQKNPTYAIGISTQSTQEMNRQRDPSKTTLIGAAVTDFSAAELESARNMFGISDNPQIDQLLSAFKTLKPTAKRLGAIYCPDEVGSVKSIDRLRYNSHGLELFAERVWSSGDLAAATRRLIDLRVDAIYLPLDNTVHADLGAIASLAQQANVPLITNSISDLKSGALIGIGIDYYTLGVQAGNMVLDHMRGQEVSPRLQLADGAEMLINAEAARRLGIVIPNNLTKYAVK